MEFTIEKDTIKSFLDFQLTKVNSGNTMLNNNGIHNFSIKRWGKKGKAPMVNPIETNISGEQNFELHGQLNPVQVTINDDRILNIFYKKP